MIRVEASRSFQVAEWRGLLEQCGGNALHLPDVQLADHDRRDLLYLVFTRGAQTLGCSVARVASRRLFGARIGSRSLVLPTAPALVEPGIAKDIYSELVRFATSSGFSSLEISALWGGSFDDDASFAKHITARTIEFVIDPRKGLEEILNSMHKIHRKNIRRAEAEGLTIELGHGVEDLMRTRAMQQAASERGADGGRRFAVRDRAYFQRAFQHVYSQGIGEVQFAKQGGEFVSCLAYLVGGGRTLTVRSGSTAKGYATRAAYLLQFELIRTANASGWHALNIGGVPAAAAVDESHEQRGLYEFKKGFGGAPFARTAIRLPLESSRT